MEYNNEQPESIFEMSIDSATANEIKKLGKWAKFNAIFFWSVLALVLLMLLLFKNKMSEAFSTIAQNENYSRFSTLLNNGAAGVLIVFLAIIFLVVGAYVLLLFNFGNKIKKGVEQQSAEVLEAGFNNYKTYIMIGVVMACLVMAISIVSLFFK